MYNPAPDQRSASIRKRRCVRHFRMKGRPQPQFFYRTSKSRKPLRQFLRETQIRLRACSIYPGQRRKLRQSFPVPGMNQCLPVRRHENGSCFRLPARLCHPPDKRKPLCPVALHFPRRCRMFGKRTVGTAIIAAFYTTSVDYRATTHSPPPSPIPPSRGARHPRSAAARDNPRAPSPPPSVPAR